MFSPEGREPSLQALGQALKARKSRIHALQRAFAAERGERFEDAGRHGRAGDRDAQRLEELAGLRSEPLEQLRQGASSVGLVERLDRREALAAAGGEVAGRLGVHHLRPRLLVVDRRLEEEADQRPELGEGLRLLLGDRAGPRERSRSAAASAWPVALELGGRRLT